MEDRFRNGRNFLATDRVPDTIFGIPVAKAEGEWTKEDLAFFRKHPEAGGYYSMGDEGPEDGTGEGAPTQLDVPTNYSKKDVRAETLESAWDEMLSKCTDPDAAFDVFRCMTGESGPGQDVDPDLLTNGYRARMTAHMNEADFFNSNPANSGRRIDGLTAMRRDSHILSKPDEYWKGTEAGKNPANTWTDASKRRPRFNVLAGKRETALVSLDLMNMIPAFLDGTLDRSGVPSDAVSYGNGSGALLPDRDEIPSGEIKIKLHPNLKLGRRKKK